jgi:hypothetical protein
MCLAADRAEVLPRSAKRIGRPIATAPDRHASAAETAERILFEIWFAD